MGYVDPEQKRKYQREWVANRRAKWIRENGPCVVCGSWDQPEVDHVDPAIKITHRVWSLAKDRMLAELSKCVVRCVTCHRVKSAGEMRKGEDHGRASLSTVEVEEIRQRLQYETQAALAREFGVARQTVWKIHHDKRWVTAH